jgi:hypothetical protein
VGAHCFSQRLAEKSRCIAASSTSFWLARYALIILPISVVRSGNRHSSAGTCGNHAPQVSLVALCGLRRQRLHRHLG